MDLSKSLEANLDELKKMTIELAYSSDHLLDENQVITLLNYGPEMFRDVKNALQYRIDGSKFDTMVPSSMTRDVELKKDKKNQEKEKRKMVSMVFKKSLLEVIDAP